MDTNEVPEMNAVENVSRFFPNMVSIMQTKESKRRDVDEWIRFGMSMGIKASMHPFEYAKTLIQLGYEPIAPTLGRSLFGKQILVLPNIFQYTAHIHKVDGFWGCYRGLGPQLYGLIANKLVNRYLIKNKGLKSDAVSSENTDSFEQFQIELRDEIVLCAAGAIVIHPFNLISVRMMAEFVGHENIYTNMITSIKEIFQTEGLAGFFNGLMPRLLWDVGCLILTSSTIYLVNKYALKDKIKKIFSVGIIQYVYSNIMYPLHVTTTCMSVCGSRLAAGRPPIMPLYKDWRYCIADLRCRGDLKRGNNLLFRSASHVYFQSQNTIFSPELSLKS